MKLNKLGGQKSGRQNSQRQMDHVNQVYKRELWITPGAQQGGVGTLISAFMVLHRGRG